MKFQIESRWSSEVKFECDLDAAFENESYGVQLGAAVRLAVKVGANLSGAYLRHAYLRGADLSGSNLSGADGENLTLVGARPVLWFGPIGSDQRTVYAFLTDHGVYVRAGCFWNTMEAFKAAVVETHGSNEHASEYAAFAALVDTHFTLFPAPTKVEAAQ